MNANSVKHKINSDLVMKLARYHLREESSSARFCMADAVQNQNDGNLDRAMVCALRSIAHSVGILHPDYTRAFHASGIGGEVRLVS